METQSSYEHAMTEKQKQLANSLSAVRGWVYFEGFNYRGVAFIDKNVGISASVMNHQIWITLSIGFFEHTAGLKKLCNHGQARVNCFWEADETLVNHWKLKYLFNLIEGG